MVQSLGRFLDSLMRRAYCWIGTVLLVLPIAAHFASNGMKRELAKLWRPEDHVWLMFAGALLLLWAAFRVWDEQRELTVELLRVWASPGGEGQPESPSLSPGDETAELKLQLAQQKGRYLTSDQRAQLVAALKEADEPIRINVVYHHLDAEAESYAKQFSAVLLTERFAGALIPFDDLPDDLDGVVIRVNGGLLPHLAQRLSDALSKAKIDHRIEPLTGERAVLAPPDYFDLAIGEMK